MKAIFSVLISLFLLVGCNEVVSSPEQHNAVDAPVIKQAVASVSVQANGLTQEQENVKKRIEMENMPGSIKHIYVLSAYSGQVIFYSTVEGKVTSSGKRLKPSTIHALGDYGGYNPELIGDDGTFGSSIEYLYWWDVQGRYHQQYITGGIFVHIADQPMQFGHVTLSIENRKE